MLDIKTETFLCVCKHMNYTKAAKELNITQPAVSKHIHMLEDYYGTRLFVYEGRTLRLTPAGEELRRGALTVMHDQRELYKRISSINEHKNSLKFGATRTAGDFVLPDFLCRYMKENKDADISMVIDNTYSLLEKLDSGDIDFALVEGYFPKNEYDYRVYSSEEFVGLGYKKMPPLDGIDGLFSNRLIIREGGSGGREILEQFLHSRNYSIYDFNAITEINSIHTILKLTAAGCGISFMYRRAAEEYIRNGLIYPIEIKGCRISHDFCFIWRKGSIYSSDYLEVFNKINMGNNDPLRSNK